MGTLADMRDHFRLTDTYDPRVRVGMQARKLWRIVWVDDSGDWDYGLQQFPTRQAAIDFLPQFIASTYA
jgi:hypothetical protein